MTPNFLLAAFSTVSHPRVLEQASRSGWFHSSTIHTLYVLLLFSQFYSLVSFSIIGSSSPDDVSSFVHPYLACSTLSLVWEEPWRSLNFALWRTLSSLPGEPFLGRLFSLAFSHPFCLGNSLKCWELGALFLRERALLRRRWGNGLLLGKPPVCSELTLESALALCIKIQVLNSIWSEPQARLLITIFWSFTGWGQRKNQGCFAAVYFVLWFLLWQGSSF